MIDPKNFYYSDGVPFHGIFREIPLSGQWIKGELKEPLYTISTVDSDLPSAHKIYMSSMNEYDAAVKLTPSWEYWKGMIKISVKIRRVIEEWREEKMLKDQAEARALLWEQAQKGNVSAQKILYESKKEEAEQRRRMSRAQQEDQRHQQLAEATISRLKVIK